MRRAPRLAPAEAAMTRTMAKASTGLGTCERATAPANAATAGSRLSRIPNVAAEIWRRAASSSVNGTHRAEDGNGEPDRQDARVEQAAPAAGEAERGKEERGDEERQRRARSPPASRRACAWRRGCRRPSRPRRRRRRRGRRGRGRRPGSRAARRRPRRAPTQRKSSARREPSTATASGPEELDGRRQAERDAVDRLVEARVHERDRRPGGDHPAERPPPGAAEPWAFSGEEDERREADPEPDEAERADLVEGARRQGGAELDGERGADDEERRRRLPQAPSALRSPRGRPAPARRRRSR